MLWQCTNRDITPITCERYLTLSLSTYPQTYKYISLSRVLKMCKYTVFGSHHFEEIIFNNFDFRLDEYKLGSERINAPVSDFNAFDALTGDIANSNAPSCTIHSRLPITFLTIVNKTHLGFNDYHIVCCLFLRISHIISRITRKTLVTLQCTNTG